MVFIAIQKSLSVSYYFIISDSYMELLSLKTELKHTISGK